jgi:hypothetical protein
MSAEPPTPAPHDLKAQIGELRSLLDDGVMDFWEYEQRRKQIISRGAQAQKPGEVTLAPEGLIIYYKAGRFLLAAIFFLGMGGFFAWMIRDPLNADNGVRAILAFFAVLAFAYGSVLLIGFIRIRRRGGRAVVINSDGIDFTSVWGDQFRVPWSEVTGMRERDINSEYSSAKYVDVELRNPRSRFRLPPREPRRKRDRGPLRLPASVLDIETESLVAQIRSHLPDATVAEVSK